MIDWEEIRRRHEERVAWEVEQGLNPVEAQAAQPAARRRPAAQTRERPLPPPGKPRYDRALVVTLYENGKRVGEIARETGAHRSTVHKILSDTGHIKPGDHGGPRRKDECSKGHSMDDALQLKGGGRACRKCKQARGREYQRRRWAARKAASA